MIDLLTVLYGTYELLDIQIEHLKKICPDKNFNLIVIENTPLNIRKPYSNDYIDLFITSTQDDHSFDGISHGAALDIGMTYLTSEIVCIFDTDYFFVKNNAFEFFSDVLKNSNLIAMGSEFFDGEEQPSIPTWQTVRKYNESLFTNRPAAWGSFYKTNFIKNLSWVITPDEINKNRPFGYIDVGYRFRKYLNDNNLPTQSFRGYQLSPNKGADFECYFEYNTECIGIHYQRGSSRRSSQILNDISRILNEKKYINNRS